MDHQCDIKPATHVESRTNITPSGADTIPPLAPLRLPNLNPLSTGTLPMRNTNTLRDDMDVSPPSPLTPVSEDMTLPAPASPPRRCSSRVPIPTSRVLMNDGLNRPRRTIPPDTDTPSETPSNQDTNILLDDPDADIIICSCDAYEFHTQQLFIMKNSPKLDHLIQSTGDPSVTSNLVDAESPLPVMHLPERGLIIHHLLTFLLPMSPVLPPSLEDMMELLSVAQGYKMDHILVHIHGSIALKDPPLVNKTNALHIYSLAQKYGLCREMVQAARVTLKSTLTIENLKGQLDLISGEHLHELWRYHQRAKANLMRNIDEFRGSDACTTLNGCVLASRSYQIPKWLDDYIVSMAATPSLFDFMEFQRALARHGSATNNGTGGPGCPFCARLPGHAIDEFWEALTAFVLKQVETAESAFFVSDRNASQGPRSLIIAPLPKCLEVSSADIILQSSDFANFRVHKSILVTASKVFKDILLSPNNCGNKLVDGLPVVQLSEDAEILRALITVLYPIPQEIPVLYERVLALLGAAQKYDMVAVQSSIRAEAFRRHLPYLDRTQVFRMYSVAFKNRLSPETEAIAHLTLDYPLTFESLGNDLVSFEGLALGKLINFREMCGNSIISCLESFLDVHGPSRIWVGCPRSKVQHPQDLLSSSHFGSSQTMPTQFPGGPRMFPFRSMVFGTNDEPNLPSWLHDLFMEEIAELKQHFTHSFTKPSRVREKYLVALTKHTPTQHDCPTCLMVHAHDGERYCVELEQKLSKARNQVVVFV